jgi:hypothetical protein
MGGHGGPPYTEPEPRGVKLGGLLQFFALSITISRPSPMRQRSV